MHRSRSLRLLVACGGWLVVGLHASHTCAQVDMQASETTSTPSTYDSHIEEALRAYDSGRFAEARTSFRRAHELDPTARTLRTIGMCSFNLGDYADAAWNLEAALSDTRKPLTDEQRKHAMDLIVRANQRIGRFRLRLSPADATVTVDGLAPLLTSTPELLLESGRHSIDLRANGYRASQSVLNVEGGDRTTLELRLVAAPAGFVQLDDGSASPQSGELTAPTAASLARTSTPDSRSKLQPTLGYVSLGVGAAGLIGFGVVSALAINKKSSLDDHCPQNTCAPAYYKQLDQYDALRTASTVSLIAGGALVALGAGLLLFSPHADHADSEHATLQPLIGPGSLGLRGQL
jgi:hypothetical protein